MGRGKKKEQPNDLFLKVIKEILVVEGHPRLLVLIGNGFLEILVNILVEHKLKNGKRIKLDSRSYSYASRLVILHEAGIIDDKIFETLDWYRGIRNRAAHEPLFEITNQDFLKLANKNYDNAERLTRLTTDLLGTIWNAHNELFTPLFGSVPVKP